MSSASTTFASGQSPTAAQVNGWAQGTLGYAQVTANQGPFTSATDLTGLAVTVTLVAGRRIRITGECLLQSSVADDTAAIQINEGATILQIRNVLCRPAVTSNAITANVVLTPSAGSHTYKLQGIRNAGTGNITMVAGATDPAFILVEDIGAV